MSVWSSSPGRVGVVIAAERKSPSYKRHSRVTESVWWSWLIARETTARLQIDREGKEESMFHGHEYCVVQASVLVLLNVEEFLHFETKGRVFSLQYSDHSQCVVLADFC